MKIFNLDLSVHSPHDSKLFIGDENQIWKYDLKTNKSFVMHELTDDYVISKFDITESSLFYIDETLSLIKSINASHEFNVTLTKRVKPQAIAVDFLTKKFYLLDKYAKTVNIMDFEGKHFGVILSDLVEGLHDIVLDVDEGLMFILQFEKSVNKILDTKILT